MLQTAGSKKPNDLRVEEAEQVKSPASKVLAQIRSGPGRNPRNVTLQQCFVSNCHSVRSSGTVSAASR